MDGLGNTRNVNLAMRRRSMTANAVSSPQAAAPGDLCDLAVHLDGSWQDESRIAFAEMLALKFGARIEACLTNCWTVAPIAGVMAGGWQDGPDGSRVLLPSDRDELRLRARVSGIDAGTTFRRYDGVEFELALALARRARTVDLFVLGRPYGAAPQSPQFVETLLVGAGAAIAVVPPELPRLLDLQTIFIGWNDSPAGSRAVASALPFLKQASKVYLATVPDESGDGTDEASASAMKAHLSHHGIPAEIMSVSRSGDTADCLLRESRSVGAGMLVVGASKRDRFREIVRGSVTQHLLTHSTTPLLLSH